MSVYAQRYPDIASPISTQSHYLAKLTTDTSSPQPSIVRLGILLLLFDVYLTWARIEKTATPTSFPPPTAQPPPTPLTNQPLVLQYLFFLALCTLRTAAFHLPIRSLCALRLPLPVLPHYPHPARISTALLVSSCTKLFPILLIVWDYDLPSSASAVSWAVIVNNVAALEILMDCGYGRAALLVGIAVAVRAVVSRLVLGVVGLEGRADVGMEAVVEAGRWLVDRAAWVRW